MRHLFTDVVKLSEVLERRLKEAGVHCYQDCRLTTKGGRNPYAVLLLVRIPPLTKAGPVIQGTGSRVQEGIYGLHDVYFRSAGNGLFDLYFHGKLCSSVEDVVRFAKKMVDAAQERSMAPRPTQEEKDLWKRQVEELISNLRSAGQEVRESWAELNLHFTHSGGDRFDRFFLLPNIDVLVMVADDMPPAINPSRAGFERDRRCVILKHKGLPQTAPFLPTSFAAQLKKYIRRIPSA